MSNETSDTPRVRYGKCFCVKYLSDYLRRKINEKQISYRELVRRAGNGISSSTVADILKGKNANPTISVVRAIAKGLGVPESEVFAAAYGRDAPEGWTESRLFELYEAYESLIEERHKKRIAEEFEDLLTIIQAFPRKAADDHATATVRRINRS
jgi:transcriptional regulator with XRE-family HTH domain